MSIWVYDILGWLAADMKIEQIIDQLPHLPRDEFRAALAYAADRDHHRSDRPREAAFAGPDGEAGFVAADGARCRAQPFWKAPGASPEEKFSNERALLLVI
jgi:hypothetical protein